MVSKKYVNDYRIDLDYNPLTKKQKMSAHYIGPRYSFVREAELGRTKRRFIAVSLPMEAAYWAMLFINAPCGHVWYAMSGIVLLMIPMFFLLTFLYRLFTAKALITREHRDKIEYRLSMVAHLSLILSAAALAGHIVYSILHRDTGADILFYIFTSVILLCAVILLKLRPFVELRETEEIRSEA